MKRCYLSLIVATSLLFIIPLVMAQADASTQLKKDLSFSPKTDIRQQLKILPDFTVRSFKISPSLVSSGDQITLVAVVENKNKSESQKVKVKFYQDNSLLWEEKINLKGGQKKTLKVKQKLSGKGKTQIQVKVDPDNLVKESSERNNQRSASLSFKAILISVKPSDKITIRKAGTSNVASKVSVLPDFSVKSVKSVPLGHDVGGNIKVKVVVESQSGGRKQSVPVSLWLGRKKVAEKRVSLSGGQKKQLTFLVKLPMAGKNQLVVSLDNEDKLKESNEGNNKKNITIVQPSIGINKQPANIIAAGDDPLEIKQKSKLKLQNQDSSSSSYSFISPGSAMVVKSHEIQWVEPEPGSMELKAMPDLIVKIKPVTEQLTIGKPYTFMATVENIGHETAPPSRVNASIITEGGVPYTFKQLEIPAISKGWGVDISFTSKMSPPGWPTGLEVVADSGSIIKESNESNNYAVESFTAKKEVGDGVTLVTDKKIIIQNKVTAVHLSKADLVVELDPPRKLVMYYGTTHKFKGTVTNSGTAYAPSSEVQLILKDPYGDTTIEQKSIPGLHPGWGVDIELSGGKNTPSPNKYNELVLIADVMNDVAEANEDNNISKVYSMGFEQPSDLALFPGGGSNDMGFLLTAVEGIQQQLKLKVYNMHVNSVSLRSQLSFRCYNDVSILGDYVTVEPITADHYPGERLYTFPLVFDSGTYECTAKIEVVGENTDTDLTNNDISFKVKVHEQWPEVDSN